MATSLSSSSSTTKRGIALANMLRLVLLAFIWFSLVVGTSSDEVVEPSTGLSARAYLCDSDNHDVTSTYSVDNTPLQIGAMLRVCIEVVNNDDDDNVTTTFDDEEIYILKVVDFFFIRELGPSSHQSVDPPEDNVFIDSPDHHDDEEQDNKNVTKVRQQVLQNGVTTDPSTTSLICSSGSRLCAFQIMSLNDVFFLTDGIVEGIGSVALQYGGARDGDRRQRHRRERRRRYLRWGLAEGDDVDLDDDVVVVPIVSRASSSRRNLQDFAGIVPVSVNFAVTDGIQENDGSAGSGMLPEVDPDDTNGRTTFSVREYWTESEPWIQGLIIGVFVIVLVIIVCLCAGLCFWRGYGREYVYDRKRQAASDSQQTRTHESQAYESQHSRNESFDFEETTLPRGHPFEGLPVLKEWSSEHSRKSSTEDTTQKPTEPQNQHKRRSYLDEYDDLSETHSIDDDEVWEKNNDDGGYPNSSVAASPRRQDPSASDDRVRSIRPSPLRSSSRGDSMQPSSPVRTISRGGPIPPSPPIRTKSGIESTQPSPVRTKSRGGVMHPCSPSSSRGDLMHPSSPRRTKSRGDPIHPSPPVRIKSGIESTQPSPVRTNCRGVLMHPCSPVRTKSSRESFRPSPQRTQSMGELRHPAPPVRIQSGVDPIPPSPARTTSGMSPSGGGRRVTVDRSIVSSFSSMATTKCSNKNAKGKAAAEKKEDGSIVSRKASNNKGTNQASKKASAIV